MKTNFKSLCTSISWEKVETASYFASKHYWELFLKHPCFSSFLEKYFNLKYLLLRMTCRNWFVEISTKIKLPRNNAHRFFQTWDTFSKLCSLESTNASSLNLHNWLHEIHHNISNDLLMLQKCHHQYLPRKSSTLQSISWINCITQYKIMMHGPTFCWSMNF